MNKMEVDKLFNFDIPLRPDEIRLLNKKSQTFYNNINTLRNMQQEMIPLFL